MGAALAFDLSALAEEVYAASLDDALWPVWTGRMIEAFDGRGALFCVIDSKRGDMTRSDFVLPDVDTGAIAAEYFGDGWFARDPQITRLAAARQSEIYRDTDHLDLDLPAHRDYAAWHEARFGLRHYMTARVIVDDTIEAALALHRDRRAGVFERVERQQLEALFPHFARAMSLSVRHGALLQESWWNGLQAASPTAGLLLDARGTIIAVSAEAERLLDAKDGLGTKDRQLTASEPVAAERLRTLVARATRDRDAAAGGMIVPRPSGRRGLRLSIYPLVRARRYLAPAEAAAVVHIADPTQATRSVTAAQREMFGLTERETQVAAHLLSGHSVESLAASLGISPMTVRVHIKALLRKTETTRQSDLIRALGE